MWNATASRHNACPVVIRDQARPQLLRGHDRCGLSGVRIGVARGLSLSPVMRLQVRGDRSYLLLAR